jgi:hypothetical protein
MLPRCVAARLAAVLASVALCAASALPILHSHAAAVDDRGAPASELAGDLACAACASAAQLRSLATACFAPLAHAAPLATPLAEPRAPSIGAPPVRAGASPRSPPEVG